MLTVIIAIGVTTPEFFVIVLPLGIGYYFIQRYYSLQSLVAISLVTSLIASRHKPAVEAHRRRYQIASVLQLQRNDQRHCHHPRIWAAAGLH